MTSQKRSRVIVVAATVGLATFAVFSSSDASTSTTTTSTTTTVVVGAPATTTTTPPTTHLGPDGVVSSAIVDENREPGTTSWRIGHHGRGIIEGFVGENDARVGNTVAIYVASSAAHFRVETFRMGYYQGTGGRLVWTSPDVRTTPQPKCVLTTGVNMVSCDNWSISLSMPVTAAFTSGDYLLKLVGSGDQQSYIPLTVWDPSSHATYLMVARTLTEQGWNSYGGYDFYTGEGPCPANSSTYPVCNRARVVSFDRPYAEGEGASDFLGNEFPLVYWAEQHGLDVTYATDVTLTRDPNIMLNHRAILSLGHDETWTNGEREGALDAQRHGVNIVFFGAAAVLRHARLQPSPLGPDREEVDYRDSLADPLNGVGNPMEVTGNTWSSPPSDWSETVLTGEAYAGYGPLNQTFAFVVSDASSWLYAGTGLSNGSQIAGVIKSDFDHVDLDAGEPNNLEVLGHSPLPASSVVTNQGTWGSDTYSDTTYWTDPGSRAGVFDTGTVNWIYSLESCPGNGVCPAHVVQHITGNLLRLFGQGPAGVLEPSVNNLSSVAPYGS